MLAAEDLPAAARLCSLTPGIAYVQFSGFLLLRFPASSRNFLHYQRSVEEHVPIPPFFTTPKSQRKVGTKAGFCGLLTKTNKNKITQKPENVNHYSKCTSRIRAATAFSSAGYFFIAGATNLAASRAFFIISRSVSLASRKFINPLWAVPAAPD